MVCCFPPALGLGRERVCSHKGSDSKLGMMAVSHLALDGDGWVFLLSSNALLLVLQVLSTTACSGVRPAGSRLG